MFFPEGEEVGPPQVDHGAVVSVGAFSAPVEQFLQGESLARLAAGVQKGGFAPVLYFHDKLESI